MAKQISRGEPALSHNKLWGREQEVRDVEGFPFCMGTLTIVHLSLHNPKLTNNVI